MSMLPGVNSRKQPPRHKTPHLLHPKYLSGAWPDGFLLPFLEQWVQTRFRPSDFDSTCPGKFGMEIALSRGR